MEHIVIFCNAPNRIEAKLIARELVEQKLVACVNLVDKVESIYAWQGAVHNETECMMVMKTKKNMFDKVNEIIQSLHSYDVPEVISLVIDKGDRKYIDWLDTEVNG